MKKLIHAALLTATCLTARADIPSDIGTELVATISGNIGIRHAGDQSNRKFAIIQGGQIRIIDAQDNTVSAPFLDISSKIASGGERGLLGLAFHPNYKNNGQFFVNYTKNGSNFGDTIIERYQVSQDPNLADANSGAVLMRMDQDFSNHNGGNILFGSDGYLYIGMGDGGSGGDPNDRAQDLSSALGKMLRIDVDSDSPPSNPSPGQDGEACPQESDNYAIPNNNPFINTQGACPEIWAYGLRNPWRWSFDKDNGDLYIGDVGQNAWEEINYQAANSSGGEHYGWNCREGFHSYSNECSIPINSMIDPVLEKSQNSGRCSITGGYNYRGPVTSLHNQYIYGDYCSGQIWIAEKNGNNWTEDEWTENGASAFGITSFGEDEMGNVYITVGSKIYRITGDVAVSDIIFVNGFEQTTP